MLDLTLKYLPLLIFIVPLMSWLDKKKRYFHNSKFYLDRAQLLKIYEEESRRSNITKHERNAFAQSYAASDKIGFQDIELVKTRYPRDLYFILQQVVKIKSFLIIIENNEQSHYESKFSINKARMRYLWIACFYFSSLLILYLNVYLLKILKFLDISPIFVSEFNLVVWQVILIIGALTIIVISLSLFIKNGVLIDLLEDGKLFVSNPESIVEDISEIQNELLT